MRRLAPLLAFLLLSSCWPEPPGEIGVRVSTATGMPGRFRMKVDGGLIIGMRAPQFAMQKDKSLVLATPAELVVQRGEGDAMISAIDGWPSLVIVGLDSTHSPRPRAEGRLIRFAHTERVGHITLTAVADTTSH